MSERKTPKTGAERMRKYRADRNLMANLTNAKQEARRSKIMASGTPEGDRLKREAAERKRRQRMRAKEQEKGRQGVDQPGNQYHHCIF